MAVSETRRRTPPPTGSRRIETAHIQAPAARATTRAGARATKTAETGALAARVTPGEGERETIEIERPATGQLLGTVPRCTADDVELAVQRARAAQAQWRETSFAERRRILLAFHDLVFDRREELLD